MSALASLPAEILHSILGRLSDPSHLASCSLVSHEFWEAAAPLLYANLDLSSEVENVTSLNSFAIFDIIAEDISIPLRLDLSRQQWLLETLATCPKLANFVKSFNNPTPQNFSMQNPKFRLLHSSDIVAAAARNMQSLCRARLRDNQLAIHFLKALNAYPQLTELYIFELLPDICPWPRDHRTNLSKITLEIPTTPQDAYQTHYIETIVKLFELLQATCPLLQSLDFIFNRPPSRSEPTSPDLHPGDSRSVNESGRVTPEPMKNLRHFGFQDRVVGQWPYYQLLNNFIKQHTTLSSLLISISSLSTGDELDFFAGLCNNLLEPKTITLTRGPKGPSDSPVRMDTGSFLAAFIKTLAAPGRAIESFTLLDVACPISQDVLCMFGFLKDLRYLRIGALIDSNLDEDELFRNGRVSFALWSSHFLLLVNELPLSLEEFYMTVHGEDSGVVADGDDPFVELADLGRPVFTHLQRLRASDICIFIDVDGKDRDFRNLVDSDIEQIPSFAIHWRRLPCTTELAVESDATSASNHERRKRARTLWTSTMSNWEPTEDYRMIEHSCQTIELRDGQGGFGGKDARGIWWDGDVATAMARNAANGRLRERPKINLWPYRRDNLMEYPFYNRMA